MIKPNNEIFIENSKYPRHRLKKRIISQKLFPLECAECKLQPNWNGKPLVLQLEHKNGINNDNRLENLCFLCPNCHSQTDSYAGKNAVHNTASPKPSIRREKLIADCLKLDEAKKVLDLTSWGWKTRLGNFLQISPQKVDKWLKRVAGGQGFKP